MDDGNVEQVAAEGEYEVVARRRAWIHSRRARAGDRPSWRRGLVQASGEDSGTPGEQLRARYWRQRAWSSRVLHRVGAITSHAGTGLVATLAVLAWVGVGRVYGFSGWWQTVLNSVSASITLVMVFVIQHTQTRQQSATQRKLDELLRAQPTANDRLIAVEEAPDQELQALVELNLADRHHAEADVS